MHGGGATAGCVWIHYHVQQYATLGGELERSDQMSKLGHDVGGMGLKRIKRIIGSA